MRAVPTQVLAYRSLCVVCLCVGHSGEPCKTVEQIEVPMGVDSPGSNYGCNCIWFVKGFNASCSPLILHSEGLAGSRGGNLATPE